LLSNHKAQLASDAGKALENSVMCHALTRHAGTLQVIANAQVTQINTTQNHTNANTHAVVFAHEIMQNLTRWHDLAMSMEDFSGNEF